MSAPSFERYAESVAATIRNYGEEDAKRTAVTVERNTDYDAQKLLERAKEILKEQKTPNAPEA